MKAVLVPTDFSKFSLNAVKYAMAYAADTKTKLILFHSYDIPGTDISFPFVNAGYSKADAKRDADRKMAKLSKALLKSFPGVQQEWLTEPGNASDNIADCIIKYKIPLVIMGTTGQGTIARELIGSTTSSVISSGLSAVIAVPPTAKYKGLKTIAVAGDNESTAPLKQVIKFAKPLKAAVTYLYVQDFEIVSADTFLKSMILEVKKQTRYKQLEYYVCRNTSISRGLDSYVKKYKPGMLVMARHERKFPETIWKQSLTNKMVSHIEVPIMVIRHENN